MEGVLCCLKGSRSLVVVKLCIETEVNEKIQCKFFPKLPSLCPAWRDIGEDRGKKCELGRVLDENPSIFPPNAVYVCGSYFDGHIYAHHPLSLPMVNTQKGSTVSHFPLILNLVWNYWAWNPAGIKFFVLCWRNLKHHQKSLGGRETSQGHKNGIIWAVNYLLDLNKELCLKWYFKVSLWLFKLSGLLSNCTFYQPLFYKNKLYLAKNHNKVKGTK